ncbi:hypothetical protein FFT88_23365 [Escherichia sp. E4930]|uniref:Uncharacterized protein n=1 Tax=Escherichia marmotae TaxID=1499973 RepID=A0A7W3APA6_9ESCH|nr:hypothetical protein [Escherichia marmotae]TLU77068.1 hypothetical protein FFT88_23365 [Escherichia sp. E4930]MEC9947272.1 hypothetical protein [Escherichia marmotae]MEC9951548.1 hypothetical protein [Escherichia marmotae]MED0174992.1 hypothetical protein [Escherichia marmotae]
MSVRKEKRKRIILTGTCWYELTGLWQLLSMLGHDVCRASPGKYCTPDAWDLVIVALSAEPVAGWGRYLPWICELRERVSGKNAGSGARGVEEVECVTKCLSGMQWWGKPATTEH